MDDQKIDEAFQLATTLTKQCGSIVLEGFRNASKAVKCKENHWDVVTEYDQKVEDVLVRGLLERFPDHRMLGEESTTEANLREPLDERPTWIIDPIDGTSNFVRGVKFIAISVALVVGGDLKIGIVYNPCLDEFYSAVKGKGAFLNGEKIKTSGIEELKQCLVAHESSIASYATARPYVFGRGLEFIKECIGLRALGSAALTLAYIASGNLDCYAIDYLQPWDIAAGALLIQEAGGVVININGGEYDILKPDVIAAGSEKLAQRVLEVVRKVEADVVRG
ncbi:inositol monophosphatase 1-like [Toxorhynchites rutilus septentrionalis]|uniref:inositol monophosphatase 1-like n=1 Tax=Toxorhynchites rutilus septentrionalis TaxID=329112 RepID=UPI00247A78BB|nr:inositol monophosphatase 1-like [Toxorhynchites rutilus septentrionalis]